MYKFRYIVTMLLSALVAVSGPVEAATINISPSGASTYSITATDLPETAGIDLSLSYDDTTLASPQVRSGGLTAGAMMEANVSIPKSVRVVFITAGAIKGTGEVASVSFSKKGAAPAAVPKLSFSVYAATGSQLAVQSTTTPDSSVPAGATENNSTVATNTAVGTGSSSGSMSTSFINQSSQVTSQTGTTVISNLSLPASGEQREESRKDAIRESSANQNVPVTTTETASVTKTVSPLESSPTVAVPEIKSAEIRTLPKSSQSAVDRFRDFNEPRIVKKLSSLFNMSALHAVGIIQTPGIVVADGKSLVTVSIELANDVDTPSFSLKGANMKSIRQVTGSLWELDAVPQKDKSDVRLSIILKGERTDIPLVAVPRINQKGTDLLSLSEAALDALIAKPFTVSKPSFDVNSDGRQDYLDDYILVGHWLLKQKPQAKKVKEKSSAAAE